MTKESASTTTAVQVALRIRPLTERDRAQPRFANLANDDVLKLHNKTVQVVPQNKLFTFDHVFGTTSTQEEIFTAIGDNLIRKFIEGYNITILAYGQTSSGKTYTMGTAAHGSVINPANEGIVPRSMALLFDLLHNVDSATNNRPISPTSSVSSSTTTSTKSASRLRPKSRIANRSSHVPHVNNNNPHKSKYTIKVSFIEIYNEDLHDLLNSAPPEESPPITIREDTKGRIYWTGVKEVLVHSTEDVLYYLEQGTQNRATGATDMNEKSSRSHAIFSVSLKQEKWVPSDINSSTKKPTRPTSSLSNRSPSRLSNNNNSDEGEWLITTSKFHFVDLAGSERLKRTAAEGDRRKEGININAGLLALGNVISALGDPSKKNVHVPYRDSKLTRLLQDSLGGSATTLMIACVSPAEYNLAETLNTLQYANRARNIKNKSEKNQVEEWMTTENIELLRSLIGKLKNELSYLKQHHHQQKSMQQTNDDLFDDASTISSSTPSMDDLYQEQRSLIADLQRQVEELDGEAAVTRERNKMVEKELQRLRLLETVTQQQQQQNDFQHLVEPVIEEYEKSVAKLESQLAMTRAALHHADIGVQEHQAKVVHLEGLIRNQEQSISDLRSRLSKVLEREQSNESYIQELEGKLMKSAQEASKDQDMLNELKNRIMKLKETDENTEQYIANLEQRLAAADAERTRLLAVVEELEAKVEARERKHMEALKKFSKQANDASSTEKLILKELDEMNVKYGELLKERDTLQLQIEQLKQRQQNEEKVEEDEKMEDETRRLSISSSSSSLSRKKHKGNRKSLANENETTSSVAALALLQTETRLKEETDRANHLQMTLDRLTFDHEETTKELDEVLQRYHETLEQIEFLEQQKTIPATDLNKEMVQADYTHQIDELTYKVQSFQKKMAIKDSELEMANDTIQKLQEELLERKQEEEATKKTQETSLSHWKQAHQTLKEDMEKLTRDLDEKEQLINQLKDRVDSDTKDQEEEIVSLQKRLAETLASLTVLKIAHEGLQKKLQEQDKDDNNSKQIEEKRELLDKISDLERQLEVSRDQLVKEHEAEVLDLSHHFEKATHELESHIADLESELETSKQLHEEILASHGDRLREAKMEEAKKVESQFKHMLEALQQELDALKAAQQDVLDQHANHMASVTAENTTANQRLSEEIDKIKKTLEASEEMLKTRLEEAERQHAEELVKFHEESEETQQQLKTEIEELVLELETSQNQHQHILDKMLLDKETAEKNNEDVLVKIKNEYEKSQQQLQARIDELTAQLLNDSSSKDNNHTIVLENLKKEHQIQLSQLRSEFEAHYAQRVEDINEQHKKTQQQLETRINELTAQLNDNSASNKDHVDRLTQEIKEMETQHEQQFAKLQTQYEKARLEKTNSEDEKKRLEVEINKLASELDQTRLDIEKEKELVAQLKKEAEHKNGHIDREAQQLLTQIETFTLQITEHQQAKSEFQAKITALENQLQQVNNELEDKRALLLLNQKPKINNKDGVASRIKMLESQLSHDAPTPLLVTRTPSSDDSSNKIRQQEQTTKDEREAMVAQHEAELAQTKKELQTQQESMTERIVSLESKVKQVQEENLEYAALSGELEKEMSRMTREMESLADELEKHEDTMNEIKHVLGLASPDEVMSKLKEWVNEKSEMSKQLAEAQQENSKAERVLEEERKKVEEERKKLEASERARKQLEKQIEELLTKKSSFLCF